MAATETQQERPLRGREKRVLALLGLPTLTLALAITVITTYVPKLASRFTGSTTVIGLIVGAEGFVALFVPLIAGAWSDRIDTRVGRRLPFLIAATPPLVAALALVGFMNSQTLNLVIVSLGEKIEKKLVKIWLWLSRNFPFVEISVQLWST